MAVRLESSASLFRVRGCSDSAVISAPRRMNYNDIHCLLPRDPTITGSVWRTRGSKQAATHLTGMNA
jgi:hypothetical protein